MVEEIQTNIENYHTVFAKTILTIYSEYIRHGPVKHVRDITKLNIIFAQSQLDETPIELELARLTPDDIDKITRVSFEQIKKLNEMPFEELWWLMGRIQKEAGLVAVQKRSRSSFYKRLADVRSGHVIKTDGQGLSETPMQENQGQAIAENNGEGKEER